MKSLRALIEYAQQDPRTAHAQRKEHLRTHQEGRHVRAKEGGFRSNETC